MTEEAAAVKQQLKRKRIDKRCPDTAGCKASLLCIASDSRRKTIKMTGDNPHEFIPFLKDSSLHGSTSL